MIIRVQEKIIAYRVSLIPNRIIMCKPLDKVLNLLPSEFSHSQLISALKRCNRDIDARSAIHHFRTQRRVETIGHHLYRKIIINR